jgi:hypothetical protein
MIIPVTGNPLNTSVQNRMLRCLDGWFLATFLRLAFVGRECFTEGRASKSIALILIYCRFQVARTPKLQRGCCFSATDGQGCQPKFSKSPDLSVSAVCRRFCKHFCAGTNRTATAPTAITISLASFYARLFRGRRGVAVRLHPPGVDREIGLAGSRQVSQNASDKTRKLEAVAAARAGHEHVLPSSHEVDQEPIRGCDGI